MTKVVELERTRQLRLLEKLKAAAGDHTPEQKIETARLLERIARRYRREAKEG